ncbi:unnamed protein product [Phytophthora fragariaefolia]|uniref:Unnamed protein product n=1 Tax=Phytophthora fragariaefolia TaxID=1490495 RepID=A0A9W7D0W0_9STRA|nr:unnamed protein product [Phytophthora fragariaefolia]
MVHDLFDRLDIAEVFNDAWDFTAALRKRIVAATDNNDAIQFASNAAFAIKNSLAFKFKSSLQASTQSQVDPPFDRIIEDNGLTAQLGVCPESVPFFKSRMKQRCKLLINSLQPEELRMEIQRMVKLELREAAMSCVCLYPLILHRARLQQHYHFLSNEFGKGRDAKKSALVAPKTAPYTGKSTQQGGRKPAQQGGSKPRAEHAKQGAAAATPSSQQRPPPRTGCWACKGPYWLDDCPTASDDAKESARQKMAEIYRSRRQVKRWRLRGYAAADGNSVRLNDLINVPFCPDTGADANVVPRRVLDGLVELRSDVRLTPLVVAQEVERYDGHVAVCTEEAHLDLRINTVAGSVNLYQVSCTVLDADTDEFLLGKVTLRSLGIDMNRMIEQLVASPALDDSDEGLSTDPVFGIIDAERLTAMVLDAAENGFRPSIYPPLQQQFLREYTKKALEERGLIRKNNSSRWASPALPVKKPGTHGEFRMTVDYRRVNARTVRVAGTSPNLAVVTSSVRGSYGLASFDLHKGFWQMGLHEDSQKMFSIMTDDAVYTPTRVPQGATDSALHFQNQIQFVFDPLLYNTVLI